MHHLLQRRLNLVVDAHEGLEDDVVDATPEEVHVDADLLEVPRQGLQTPLVPAVVQVRVRIVNVLVVLLVDGEVGEVSVLGAFAIGLVVGLGGEAHQPLVVDVDAPRVHRCHAHVQPQVKLQPVDQERVCDVPTDDAVLVNWHLGDVVDLSKNKGRLNA